MVSESVTCLLKKSLNFFIVFQIIERSTKKFEPPPVKQGSSGVKHVLCVQFFGERL